MEASNAHELKDLIKNQPRIYRDVMRSKIDNYLDTHPFLIVDDPDSGKVIAVSVKGFSAREDLERTNSAINRGICLKPLPASREVGEQYYLLIGDNADFNRPLSKNGYCPQAVIIDYITRYQVDHNGVPPSGARLADVMREHLNEKLSDAYPSGMRPRNVEAVLISNPIEEHRLHGENYTSRIHVLQHEEDGDEVVIMDQSAGNPARFSSRGVIWDMYQDHLAKLECEVRSPRRKKNSPSTPERNLELKLTAAIAALITDPHIQGEGPSVIDAVTIPFIPPKGNKNRARYDLEFITPLYEKALKLL